MLEHHEEGLMASPLTDRAKRSIKEYVDEGKDPGGFLSAVFSNDLFGSVGRADILNQTLIHEYVRVIYTHTPMGCHGSKEKVKAWMKEKKEGKNDNN